MMIPKQLQQNEFKFCLLKEKDKIPFEKGWQNNGYSFDDQKLKHHKGNYGVIGGKGRLRILDIDDKNLGEIFEKQLNTFTIKTGSGGRHFYFLSDYETNHVMINELGELRAKNYQVVGANCIHPNGNTYEVVKDVKIAEIEEEELMNLIGSYLRDESTSTSSGKKIEGKDTSRSGLEFRKILSLLRQGKEKEFIYQEMVAYSKWKDSSDQYKDYTFNKANKIHEETIKDMKEVINVYYGKSDLANRLLTIQPLYYDEGKLWWAWDSGEFKWLQIDETGILNLVRQLSIANTVGSKERCEILEALKQESRLRKPKETKKTWIQFKNKIFDIETGENFEATAEYFVTNPVPYEVGDEDNTPTMDRIFEEWVGKDYVQTLYEIIAYCLIPDYPIHRLFCLIGEGMNGKSCFLNLLKKFVGISNCCSTELDLLLSSKFEVTRLHKKLVCIMGETNFNEMNKTSIIKKLTGGDLIGFEYKNKNPFEDINYAKIVLATNNLPTTDDKTIGFYRRWAIIDFPNGFSEEKDILLDIPEGEYNCLSTKCIFVLNKLLKERKFHNEGSLKERMKRYEEKSNPFEQFWDKNIKEDYEIDLTKAEFKVTLQKWCKKNKFRMLSDRNIMKMMKNKGVDSGVTYIDWYQEGSLVQKKQAKAWKGVMFK